MYMLFEYLYASFMSLSLANSMNAYPRFLPVWMSFTIRTCITFPNLLNSLLSLSSLVS